MTLDWSAEFLVYSVLLFISGMGIGALVAFWFTDRFTRF